MFLGSILPAQARNIPEKKQILPGSSIIYNSLAPKHEVRAVWLTTIGGIVGKIVQVTEDTITFETGEDRVRIQTKKWAVSTTAKMEAAEAEAKNKKRK